MVLGEWLGLEYTLAAGAVEAWELHCNGATVSVPDAVFGTPEVEWVTVDTGDNVFGTAFLLLTREEAGLAYNATLGYSARPGFRAGTCREYPVFDLSSRQELRLRERPLVLMDTPTLDRIDDPEVTIRRLRDECERVRGDFTVLWHNNWLVTRRQRRLLQAALGETP